MISEEPGAIRLSCDDEFSGGAGPGGGGDVNEAIEQGGDRAVPVFDAERSSSVSEMVASMRCRSPLASSS